MSIPFRVGYCVNCGEQAYVSNFRGAPMSPLPGTKLVYLVLYDDTGDECRVGTLMVCAKCDVSKLVAEDIIKSLFESPASGITGKEIEWGKLPHRRFEVYCEFSPIRE